MPLVMLLPVMFLVVSSTIKAVVTLIASSNQSWQLFDDEQNSPLYCDQNFADLIDHGPNEVTKGLMIKAGSAVLCLPPRTDFFAPARPSGTRLVPLCTLIESVPYKLPDSLSEVYPCASR